MKSKPFVVPRSKLLQKTILLLKNRREQVSMAQISKETGLGERWLWALVCNQNHSASINRVEALYVHLTGKPLVL